MNTIKDLQINVFSDSSLPGSLQFFHIFDDKKDMLKNFDSFQVDNDFDHSFVYFSSKNSALVKWKNKAGPIQFCGSAAYGLACLVRSDKHIENFTINSDKQKLKSIQIKEGIFLEVPAAFPIEVRSHKDGCLFLDRESGIYIFEALEERLLYNELWINKFLNKEFKPDIHGFCLFYWDKLNSNGKLRYFTPWHGRDEDYVTGSIHQPLTPLVYKLYCQEKQTWWQVSKSGGRVNTSFLNQKVLINGTCDINIIK